MKLLPQQEDAGSKKRIKKRGKKVIKLVVRHQIAYLLLLPLPFSTHYIVADTFLSLSSLDTVRCVDVLFPAINDILRELALFFPRIDFEFWSAD